MIGKLLGIGVLGLTLNKLVYGLLLRSPKARRQEMYGEGEIRVISHNALGKFWVSPMKVRDLEVQPLFQMTHLHDILLTKQKKDIFAFRPRAYHENLNMALSTIGLSVPPK